MTPKQRDIVLIPLPFTDLSSTRRRPVIVISNDDYNHKTDDVVVVAMTSNPIQKDYVLTITNDDLEIGQPEVLRFSFLWHNAIEKGGL